LNNSSVSHITTVHPRYDTRIFFKECSSLVLNGYHVVLVVADGLGDEVVDGVDISDLGCFFGGRAGRFLIGSYCVVKFALEKKIKFLHLHDPELLIIGQLLKFFGIQIVYDMHENLPKQILTKSWIPTWIRKPLSKLISVMMRVLLHNVPVVFAEKSYVQDYNWIRKYVVVQNFPSLATTEFEAVKKYDVFTVGYIGGVSRERGILTVISAIGEVRRLGYNVNFECLGPINAEVANNPLFLSSVQDGWVNAPGRVDGPIGWSSIARCHVGVAILSPLPNYKDSWPTKMFEYMAMRLPVLVSDFPLYRSVVVNNSCGIVVDPESVSAVVEALILFIEKGDIASAMGARGQALVMENYTWANESCNLLKFYEDLLKNAKL